MDRQHLHRLGVGLKPPGRAVALAARRDPTAIRWRSQPAERGGAELLGARSRVQNLGHVLEVGELLPLAAALGRQQRRRAAPRHA